MGIKRQSQEYAYLSLRGPSANFMIPHLPYELMPCLLITRTHEQNPFHSVTNPSGHLLDVKEEFAWIQLSWCEDCIL